jgi:hypothetical protein
MRRRLLSLLLATVFVAGLPAALAAPATLAARLGAGPSPAEPGPPSDARATRALADLDGDGISDDLAPRLRRAPPERRLPVIISHDGSLDPASARRAAGVLSVDRRFRLVDAFLARATPAQVRTLASLPADRQPRSRRRQRRVDDRRASPVGAAQRSRASQAWKMLR